MRRSCPPRRRAQCACRLPRGSRGRASPETRTERVAVRRLSHLATFREVPRHTTERAPILGPRTLRKSCFDAARRRKRPVLHEDPYPRGRGHSLEREGRMTKAQFAAKLAEKLKVSKAEGGRI